MGEIEVILFCFFCDEKFVGILSVPDGWITHRCAGIEEGKALCPKHSNLAEWVRTQCVGCVGGWDDCALVRDFGYGTMNLNSHDFEVIESGICPRRTNGMFGIRGVQIEDIDLSDRSSSGKALACAIKEYVETFG